MKIELTEKHKESQAQFRAFTGRHIAPHAGEFDRRQAIPRELVGRLAAEGYFAAHIPREHGGRGLDMTSYGLLHEEIGRGCSSVRSLLTVHDMVAEAILRHGTEEQVGTWLPVFTAGGALAAFALTEPEVGSDAQGIQTTASEDGGGYVLNGRKKWISFGQLADVFLVMARCDGSIAGFLVGQDAPGLSISPMRGLLGLRGSMLAELELKGCRVDGDARVGRARMPPGLFTASALHHGRFSVAWGCVGIAEACLEASFEYSSQREQFGVPLEQHQLVRRLLTDMLTDVRAAWLLCLGAADLRQRQDPRAVQETLIAKYFASRMASRVASSAVQIHGAQGCIDACPVERHFRDARIMEIIEGSNEIQQLTIAKLARQRYAAE